ncbi:MAG: glycosyltransferase [Actinomycetota bacterium]|nr:glycosyltransferase [Actinomycetota bacterium]
MADVLPTADLYALSRDRAVDFAFGDREVTTTFLDRVGPLRERRAWQLPLMPVAWRYVTRSSYDLVVTSSHACAKGFWPGRNALHLCYCYTPMRYVWLPGLDERRRVDGATRVAARALRSWDLASTRWVDEFAAISSAVQARIHAFYRRDARVIHPPVDTDYFTPGEGRRREFALAVSRMVPYKRLDVVIEACHSLDYPLVIAGSGPDEQRLRRLARRLRANVTFVVGPSDQELRNLYRTARVAVFPADEDFGIVPVEAQGCGTPVVALERGGSVDIVVPGETGVLVREQTEECFRRGIEAALTRRFDESRCRNNAERFSRDRFRAEFGAWVRDSLRSRGRDVDCLRVA